MFSGHLPGQAQDIPEKGYSFHLRKMRHALTSPNPKPALITTS